MAFTSLTSAQCDADSPLDETLMQLIRTNLDDLDSRVNALAAISSSDIRDDFVQDVAAAGGPNSVIWTTTLSATPGTALVVAPHYLRLNDAGAATKCNSIEAKDDFMHIAKGEDYIAVLEFRIKNAGADNGDIFFGWNDRAQTGDSCVTDVTDCIGITRGSASDWDITIDSGGTLGAPVRTGQGAQASWTKFKFTVTCTSTGTPQVEIDVDDVSSGSAITTNIPSVFLRPCGGHNRTGAGNTDLQIDYVLAYFSGRPLSA